jgi:hypothetical protein
MVAGVYRSLKEGVDHKLVFLENDVVEYHVNDKEKRECKWRMVGSEVFIEVDRGIDAGMFGFSPVEKIYSTSPDSLKWIAFIRDEIREDVPSEHQVSYEKVKAIKPNAKN